MSGFIAGRSPSLIGLSPNPRFKLHPPLPSGTPSPAVWYNSDGFVIDANGHIVQFTDRSPTGTRHMNPGQTYPPGPGVNGQGMPFPMRLVPVEDGLPYPGAGQMYLPEHNIEANNFWGSFPWSTTNNPSSTGRATIFVVWRYVPRLINTLTPTSASNWTASNFSFFYISATPKFDGTGSIVASWYDGATLAYRTLTWTDAANQMALGSTFVAELDLPSAAPVTLWINGVTLTDGINHTLFASQVGQQLFYLNSHVITLEYLLFAGSVSVSLTQRQRLRAHLLAKWGG